MKRWFLILILCFGLQLEGCKTIRPVDHVAVAASYDNNVRDSGLISANEQGAIITSHARDRYNNFIELYAKDPQFVGLGLRKDFGITIGLVTARGQTYNLTLQGLKHFLALSRLHSGGVIAK